MTTLRCPICTGESNGFRVVRGYSIERCQSCEHLFCPVENKKDHVQSVYGDEYFSGSPDGYVDYLSEETQQRKSARNYVNLIKKHAKEPGFLLDIGAACGFLADEFLQAGWRGQIVEPNARMRQIASEQYGLQVAESYENIDHEQRFDLITMIQVVSHFVDPKSVLQFAHRKLNSSGMLLIETWDRESRAAKLFGQHWHEWNPPSVLHWFSRSSLALSVKSIGFNVIEVGKPKKAIQVGRACKMIQHSWNGSVLSRCLTLPLSIVPKNFALPYLLDDVYWILFRKT